MARTVAADAAYKCAILLLIIYLSWGVGGEKITPVRRVSVPTSRVRSPIWQSGTGRGHGGCERGVIGVLALVWVLGPLLLLTRCCLAPRTPWPAHIRPAYTGPSQCPRTHRARCHSFARSPGGPTWVSGEGRGGGNNRWLLRVLPIAPDATDIGVRYYGVSTPPHFLATSALATSRNSHGGNEASSCPPPRLR